MDAINFTYWLQGFFEVSDAKKLDEKQVQIIKDHLGLVFNKVTPNRESAQKKTTLQDDLNVNLFTDFVDNSSISNGEKKYCSTTTFSLKDVATKVIC